MARADLEQSWAITMKHLEAASVLLPENAVAGPDGGRLAEYRHYLEHNEFELALDELADVGLANSPPVGFWQNLHKAAANMGLANHVARFQRKVEDR
jgi:hypothetical protein